MKPIPILLGVLFLAAAALAADVDTNAIDYNPAVIRANNLVTFYFHIVNKSTIDARDVALQVAWPPGFSVERNYGGDRIAVLKAGSSALAKFDVRVASDVQQGSYEIRARTLEGTDLRRERPFNVAVMNDPQIEIIRGESVSLEPGQNARFSVHLKNVGHGPARNLVVRLDSTRTITTTGVVVDPDVVPLGSASQLVERLEVGEETRVTFEVVASKTAELKAYSLPIVLRYQNPAGTEFSGTTYVGLTVVSHPVLDGTLAEIEPALVPGGNAKLTFNVFNVGSASAKYVVAEIKPFEGATLSESKIFVGTLDSDDFDSFTLDLHLQDDAPTGPRPLELVLTYKDDAQATQIQTVAVTVHVFDPADVPGAATAESPLVTIAIALVVLGLAFFGYQRFKKKK